MNPLSGPQSTDHFSQEWWVFSPLQDNTFTYMEEERVEESLTQPLNSIPSQLNILQLVDKQRPSFLEEKKLPSKVDVISKQLLSKREVSKLLKPYEGTQFHKQVLCHLPEEGIVEEAFLYDFFLLSKKQNLAFDSLKIFDCQRALFIEPEETEELKAEIKKIFSKSIAHNQKSQKKELVVFTNFHIFFKNPFLKERVSSFILEYFKQASPSFYFLGLISQKSESLSDSESFVSFCFSMNSESSLLYFIEYYFKCKNPSLLYSDQIDLQTSYNLLTSYISAGAKILFPTLPSPVAEMTCVNELSEKLFRKYSIEMLETFFYEVLVNQLNVQFLNKEALRLFKRAASYCLTDNNTPPTENQLRLLKEFSEKCNHQKILISKDFVTLHFANYLLFTLEQNDLQLLKLFTPHFGPEITEIELLILLRSHISSQNTFTEKDLIQLYAEICFEISLSSDVVDKVIFEASKKHPEKIFPKNIQAFLTEIKKYLEATKKPFQIDLKTFHHFLFFGQLDKLKNRVVPIAHNHGLLIHADTVTLIFEGAQKRFPGLSFPHNIHKFCEYLKQKRLNIGKPVQPYLIINQTTFNELFPNGVQEPLFNLSEWQQ